MKLYKLEITTINKISLRSSNEFNNETNENFQINFRGYNSAFIQL